MKICTTCRVEKPFEFFEKDSRYKSGYRSQCTACNRAGKSESARKRHLSKYGMSLEEYVSMAKAQGDLCAICGLPETRVTRPKAKIPSGHVPQLAVDHNHTTGEIRALLCHKCNVGLGNFQDSSDLLLAAYQYLKRYETQ